MRHELVEYDWNDRTHIGTFTYERDGQEYVQMRPQPFAPPAPDIDAYWAEVIWFAKTQR